MDPTEKFLEKYLNLLISERIVKEYLKAAKRTANESDFKVLGGWSSLIMGDVEGKIADTCANGMIFQCSMSDVPCKY